jgi:hypothetical protein
MASARSTSNAGRSVSGPGADGCVEQRRAGINRAAASGAGSRVASSSPRTGLVRGRPLFSQKRSISDNCEEIWVELRCL